MRGGREPRAAHARQEAADASWEHPGGGPRNSLFVAAGRFAPLVWLAYIAGQHRRWPHFTQPNRGNHA
jgi:hypothetical protein